uniref:ABC transporter domain-containing protein n=1 Tax=Aegilops tauschii subsp. strangulata TaxID=200361 RepID=A0A452XXE5_AEGTS
MGLVSQEPALFNDTIRANIAYGKEGEATESDIVSAAQLANAHKFISSLHQVRTHSFIHKSMGTTRWSGSAALSCREGRSSGWRSRGPWPRTPGSCCWTRRRARWTRSRSGRCRTRWTGWRRAGR